MHQRAFHLRTSTASHPIASTLTFSSLLQAAASQAWARLAMIHTTTPNLSSSPNRGAAGSDNLTRESQSPIPKPSGPTSSPCIASTSNLIRNDSGDQQIPRRRVTLAGVQYNIRSHKPTRSKAGYKPHAPSVGVTYFDPKHLRDSDWSYFDDEYIIPSEHPLVQSKPFTRARHRRAMPVVGTPVSSELEPLPIPPLPSPTSKQLLYQNLLHLFQIRNASLPTLLDFHDFHPTFRSTRSYNFLIALAIRHASFGTAQWLLTSMRDERVVANMETWKLKVRWLVRSGWWHKAWDQMMTEANIDLSSRSPPDKLPAAIWIEFCSTLKRGTVRRRIQPSWTINKSGESIHGPTVEITTESFSNPDVYLRRQKLLLQTRPQLTLQELNSTSPRAIYFLVRFLLHSQQRDAALSLTQSYLSNIPRTLTTKWAFKCLDIIHLHVAFGALTTGRRRMYETLATLNSLLHLHTSLRPTSTTLFLLISPLNRAKHSGTVAQSVVRRFQSRWGSQTEDRRVRRRVATLALKEGRLDIADKIFRVEKLHAYSRKSWALQREVLGGIEATPYRKLLRARETRALTKNQREEYLWRLLRSRVHRLRRRKGMQ
ncbi:hypothetical protein BDQ12DRAFT_679143 [Crucibulum laeve]|uniref:Uncharacterized protein n=1 Tax=Crucibulum laeve TaxID=68775 RepID=A0A5C3M9V8_9AGAR|nr:hypothetical protein BDQ12DRAFT_679143 [Crucibulum laeve]